MQPVINTPGTFLSQKDACFHLKQQKRKIVILSLQVDSTIISNQVIISDQALVPALGQNDELIEPDFGARDSTKWITTMCWQGSPALVRQYIIPLPIEGERLGEGVRFQRATPLPGPFPSREREF